MGMEYTVLERTNWHELRSYPNGDIDIVALHKNARVTAVGSTGGIAVVNVPIPNLSIDGAGRAFVDDAGVGQVKGTPGDWFSGKTYRDFPLVVSLVNAECVFFSSVIQAYFCGQGSATAPRA